MSAPGGSSEIPIPADFAVIALTMPIGAMTLHYGRCYETVRKWVKAQSPEWQAQYYVMSKAAAKIARTGGLHKARAARKASGVKGKSGKVSRVHMPDDFAVLLLTMTQAEIAKKIGCSVELVNRRIRELPADDLAALAMVKQERRRINAKKASDANSAKPSAVKARPSRAISAKAGTKSQVNWGYQKPAVVPLEQNRMDAGLMQALRRHPMRFSNVYNAGREHGLNGPYVAGFNRLADLPALVAFCATLGIAA